MTRERVVKTPTRHVERVTFRFRNARHVIASRAQQLRLPIIVIKSRGESDLIKRADRGDSEERHVIGGRLVTRARYAANQRS